MASQNTLVRTHNSRVTRSQARTALKEKENINISSPIERKLRKPVKVVRKQKQIVRQSILIAEQVKRADDDFEPKTIRRPIPEISVDARLGAELHSLDEPNFENVNDTKMKTQQLPPRRRVRTGPYGSAEANAHKGSLPPIVRDANGPREDAPLGVEDAFDVDDDRQSYIEESSYQPDPNDPFGFVAAERKVKHARQLLGEQEAKDSWRRDGRRSRGQDSFSISLDRSENENNDEEAERAFATPARPRQSRVSRSPTPSAPTVAHDTAEKARICVDEEEPSIQMTTMDLELLLPRRRAGRRGKRAAHKVRAVVENEDVDEYVAANGRRGRRVQLKHEDKEEVEEISLDEDAAKARTQRKKLFDDLQGYSLVTETYIWL
ncbi:hypothetical protein FRB97_002298 [Tulasnella sp. 331]|nr:hypothetical protein FRB97_002298 [Tulasnella sp. 331]KAG8884830.1 hypothetical protein FRB98_002120 [Tulasnella sp. 332]